MTTRGDANRISKLAGYGKAGKIRVNKHVPTTYKGIRVRDRLLRHERVERKLRCEHGLTYAQAHKAALKEEHRGLTPGQIAQYEGKLGNIARNHPYKRRKRCKKK